MTDNPTAESAAKAAEKDAIARRAWFGQFGYTGEVDELVTLRNDLGVASTQYVWRIYKGLCALADAYTGQFHRTANSAYGERRPVDVARRLALEEYGELTDYSSGEWKPGRREVVVAMLDLTDDDGVPVASFAEEPLVRKEVAKAA